jgi:hypothetical protein
MGHGFYLFVDEAGDEGLDRVRPLDPDGASEYFVLCGILVRTGKYAEIAQSFNRAKALLGMDASEQVHFRDLDQEQKLSIISSLATLKFGAVAIVSNKRNMQGYRNLRCEAKNLEVIRGRNRPRRYNWFYNGLFRYLLERASSECRRWTYSAYGELRSIKIVFSRRKEISYPQTKAYLYKLKSERHDRTYFNNRRQIDWSVVDISGIDSRKDKDEAGLQIADCVASAIYRSLDETWFGNVTPLYLEILKDRFIRTNTTPWDYGFKLLPDNFRAPLSESQRRGLESIGYRAYPNSV